MKRKTCAMCHKPLDHNLFGKTYCSNACRQKAYNQRKKEAGLSPRKTHVCVRCGMSTDGSKYCSKSCKSLTNREKHNATIGLYKVLYGFTDYDAYQQLDGNWKTGYTDLERRGYVYKPSNKTWVRPDAQPMLKGLEDE